MIVFNSLLSNFNSLFSSFILLGSSSPSARSAYLDVRLNSGIFRGVSTANGTEHWLGIPYARPPVGSLRFKAPVPVASSSATHNASTFGNACPQPSSNPLGVDPGAPIDEDCLFLNIFRPANTTAASALPVLVWFHGGAWTIGSGSDPSTDPTRIILRSVSKNKPIIFISINYRLNTFGFLASNSMEPQDLNAGLLDQRQALTFIQDNIAAFGGDPKKVTIWGQSVGAGSVEAHFLYPTQRSLFRAGIAESPTGPFKTSPPASVYDRPGQPFTRLLNATGCSAGVNAISCLQAVPFQTLLNISNLMISTTLNGQVWQPCVGPPGSFAAEFASARIERGDFLHLPYIAGTNANEGTSFSTSLLGLGLTGPAQDAAFSNFIGKTFIDASTISPDLLQQTMQVWPANELETVSGPSFDTTGANVPVQEIMQVWSASKAALDSSVDTPSGDALFDRAQAWYTDAMFLAPRRLFTNKASSLQPTWTYYFTELIPGNNPALGVFHGIELPLLFGPVSQVETEFANQFLDFHINFVNNLNPGPAWPPHSDSKQVLQLKRDNITLIPDTFDLDKTTFLSTPRVLAEFQK